MIGSSPRPEGRRSAPHRPRLLRGRSQAPGLRYLAVVGRARAGPHRSRRDERGDGAGRRQRVYQRDLPELANVLPPSWSRRRIPTACSTSAASACLARGEVRHVARAWWPSSRRTVHRRGRGRRRRRRVPAAAGRGRPERAMAEAHRRCTPAVATSWAARDVHWRSRRRVRTGRRRRRGAHSLSAPDGNVHEPRAVCAQVDPASRTDHVWAGTRCRTCCATPSRSSSACPPRACA